MPLHDWTRVPSGLFHHFHQAWALGIAGELNGGRLPAGFSALVEQCAKAKEPDVLAVEAFDAVPDWSQGGGTAVLDRPKTRIIRESDPRNYARRADRIAIRHHLGRVVAMIEIVSPGNKDSIHSIERFVDKVTELIFAGIHVLVIDVHPPTPRDPAGIHQVIWSDLSTDSIDAASSDERILASFESDNGAYAAFVETVTVDQLLPEVPLFLAPGIHVKLPLEAAYQFAWNLTPESVRRLLVDSAG